MLDKELAPLSATQQQSIEEAFGPKELEIKDLHGITRNQGVEWIGVFIVRSGSLSFPL